MVIDLPLVPARSRMGWSDPWNAKKITCPPGISQRFFIIVPLNMRLSKSSALNCQAYNFSGIQKKLWLTHAFIKLDAFYEEVIFFLIFFLLNQQWGVFLCIIGLQNCVREYKTCHSPRSFDLCNDTSVFCMDDVFELLSKLNVYVQGVRLIPVGFQTKLNTLFDIAVVWKRKRRNEGWSRLHFARYSEVLIGKSCGHNDNQLKYISNEFNDC